MSDFPNGTSQNADGAPAPGTAGNPPTANVAYSDLAATRAQRQATVPGAAPLTDSGQGGPTTQEQPQAQRSEYIPRDRFDEVNARRIAAEAQLQQLSQMTQAQAQAAAYSNSGYGQAPQQLGHQAVQSQPVQDFLGTLSSKEEQEKWRQKIINQPVTGIAELIQHAIRTEGAALLQQQLGQLQQQITPIQSYYQAQQAQVVDSYARNRAADPNAGWASVSPVFSQLVNQARQSGYQLTPQTLQIIEGVARTHVGLPAWSAPAQAQVPFTERPAGSGFAQQNQAPALTADQRKVATMLGVDPTTYARNLQTIRSMNRE